jgi:16S rRNA (cytosine1402-N4)-methyltransferase
MFCVDSLIKEMNNIYHYPVLHRELLGLLSLKGKKVIVDCTIGVGSHALKIFAEADSDARLIGIDKDEESLAIARTRLKAYQERLTLFKGNFSDLGQIFENLGIKEADIFLFDLGISLYQLSEPERGFSFLRQGPLDMRMDKNAFISAYDLVNNLSERELIDIFRRFGEERYAKKIAYAITRKRQVEPISSTGQLSRIVVECYGGLSFKIHPATKVFQALRIAVNRELESLTSGFSEAIKLLGKGGRIAVISFHSLEDRIVKHTIKKQSSLGILKIITKKPLTPDSVELSENNASRSAKLRVAEKI